MSERFIDRVIERLPAKPPAEYQFLHWPQPGKPTDEGFGILSVPGAKPEAVLACVFDVDAYTRNVPHVDECRAIADERFVPPQKLRFYQRIKVPLLGEIHHELVLERLGVIKGYEVAAWTLLEKETEALTGKGRIRSQYNEGAWLVADGVVGYALSSSPRRDDVGFLKWKALTSGADAIASGVVRENIDGMSRWAARR